MDSARRPFLICSSKGKEDIIGGETERSGERVGMSREQGSEVDRIEKETSLNKLH